MTSGLQPPHHRSTRAFRAHDERPTLIVYDSDAPAGATVLAAPAPTSTPRGGAGRLPEVAA